MRRGTVGVLAALAALAAPVPAFGDDDAHRPLAPVGLTVGDRARPLDVEGIPQFGWQPRDRDGNEIQTAYELRVLRGDDHTVIWDSDEQHSSDEAYVPYGGPALSSATTYTWTVRTWDRTGLPSPWSAPAEFGTGITDGEWAGAQWIRRATAGNDATEDYTLARR